MITGNYDSDALVDLLSAVGDGDQRAFSELYRSTSPHLYALLLRMLKRRDWAEEALQDCFFRVWQRAETYQESKGRPMTWLMTIARYRALDLLRARRPEVEMPEEAETPPMTLADPLADPAGDAQQAEGLGRLDDCMQQLHQEQKKSVLLAYYEGYTHQELSRLLRAPLGTVKSWVRRGLAQLRECLEAA